MAAVVWCACWRCSYSFGLKFDPRHHANTIHTPSVGRPAVAATSKAVGSMGQLDVLLFVWRLLWFIQAGQIAAHAGRCRAGGCSEPRLAIVCSVIAHRSRSDGVYFVCDAGAFGALAAHRAVTVLCHVCGDHHARGMVVLPRLQHGRDHVVHSDCLASVGMAARIRTYNNGVGVTQPSSAAITTPPVGGVVVSSSAAAGVTALQKSPLRPCRCQCTWSPCRTSVGGDAGRGRGWRCALRRWRPAGGRVQSRRPVG